MPTIPKSILVEPLEPLNIEEVRFWLRIMEEHAIFIAAGLPCASTGLINEAQGFREAFARLRQRADRVNSDRRFRELVTDAQNTVRDFVRFKRRLLNSSIKCTLGGTNFPLQLDHMIREAEYVIRLFDKIMNNRVVSPSGLKAGETSFWLRIMTDHMKFIRQKLDPSERGLIHVVERFSHEFDDLLMQGRDYTSMLISVKGEVPSFRRFIQDVRSATMRLRDFEKAATAMVEECRVLSIIPALFVDHVYRETEHFLIILAMMEKGAYNGLTDNELQDIEEVESIMDLDDAGEVGAEGEVEEEDDQEMIIEERDKPANKIPEEKVTLPEPEDIMPEADIEVDDDGVSAAFEESLEEEAGEQSQDEMFKELEKDVSVDVEIDDDASYKLNSPIGFIKNEKPQKETIKETIEEHKEIKQQQKQDNEPSAEPPKQAKAGKEPKYKWGSKWPRPLGKKY